MPGVVTTSMGTLCYDCTHITFTHTGMHTKLTSNKLNLCRLSIFVKDTQWVNKGVYPRLVFLQGASEKTGVLSPLKNGRILSLGAPTVQDISS